MKKTGAKPLFSLFAFSHTKQFAEHATQTFRASPNDNFHVNRPPYDHMTATPTAINVSPSSHFTTRHGRMPPIKTPAPNAAATRPTPWFEHLIPHHTPTDSISALSKSCYNSRYFIALFYRHRATYLGPKNM